MPVDPYAAPRLEVAWTFPLRQPDGRLADIEDSFILTCKSEDQLKKWADKIMELANAERKNQKEDRARLARLSERNSVSERYYPQSSFAPPTPAWEHPPPLATSAHWKRRKTVSEAVGQHPASAPVPPMCRSRPPAVVCRASKQCRLIGTRSCEHVR